MSKKRSNIHRKKKAKLTGEIRGLIIIAIGLLLTASMHNGAGHIGGGIRYLLLGLFSSPAFLIPYIVIVTGVLVFTNNLFIKSKGKQLYFLFIFLSLTVLKTLMDQLILNQLFNDSFTNMLSNAFQLGTNNITGGTFGVTISFILVHLFGYTGTYIIIITGLIVLTMINFNISLLQNINKVNTYLPNVKKYFIKLKNKVLPTKNNVKNTEKIEEQSDDKIEEKIKILDYTETKKEPVKSQSKPDMVDKEDNFEDDLDNLHSTQEIENENFSLPSTDLLNQLDSEQHQKEDKKSIHKKAIKLEETLKNFGVQAKIIQVSKGPTVTRFELQPATGVKVSKIVNLSDDIALNLAASAIRIEAPIPGKAAVGIEIPNDNISMVTLKEILDHDEYKTNRLNVPFALGKDVSGSPLITDITKMPHLLIAGATGSGKSVCINTLILSILYSATPESVRLLLIDPKVVELNQYNGIPHLLIPVVTEPKRATKALNWAVQEMNQRYKLFAESGVKDITGYNSKFSDNKLPYIVIVIDELADLMMVASNDVEDTICRLAQMARAAGLHLIIATQRPSVDVITGVIKANIPSRIAFSVTSQTDSRTILDSGGAEKLLGKGDMLFYPTGFTKPSRIQGAFVSENEVERVVSFVKNQVENPGYESEVIETLNENNDRSTKEELDELYDDALQIVIESQQASISMLQRRLKIGYNRAARLIDSLEKTGIVGGHEGSKPRQVLVDHESLKN
ncbi:DNA translocase FtsK 4TM domain-containing protein [Serpentinicella sp. ANB-PHB4]|uniref:FtsK/SpoIIIE family DNA translocase n=1 Tax=Serpentinicella sp. ANB-PHB4 TaxID=3074076 RepID=UPI002856FA14|nr:DNA translocase FtsK 4TM domain-containing protein [Serpentinicella sp. ANB-PHB4]MDR5658129.1 DNA translocase FtsK 4TM domain-containing protein [Serpentinicella sp. ANB-PHB4]